MLKKLKTFPEKLKTFRLILQTTANENERPVELMRVAQFGAGGARNFRKRSQNARKVLGSSKIRLRDVLGGATKNHVNMRTGMKFGIFKYERLLEKVAI